VLANRRPKADCRVLLLESGGEDDSPLIKTPSTYMMLQDSKVDWAYRTVPQVHLGGRRIFSPRGRVLGGSSSINFGIYMRGNSRDFDRWRDSGNPGWGYADVLPYFKRAEDNRDIHDDWHGQGGPLTVTSPPTLHPLVQPYLDAAQEAGLPFNADFNGARQFGCGLFQRTIRTALVAVPRRLRVRPCRANLTVLTRAYVTALRLEGECSIGSVHPRWPSSSSACRH
jgi:choline dehydrogenase